MENLSDTEIDTGDGGDVDLDAVLSSAYDTTVSDEDVADTPTTPAEPEAEISADDVDNNDDGKTADDDNADSEATNTDEATPPAGWDSEQRKELYATASPELRSQIAAREDEMVQGIEKLKGQFEEKAQVADGFEQVMTPYLDQIAKEGGTPLSAVSLLMKTAHVLRVGTPEQKLAIIQNTARDFGIPLNGTGTGETDDEFTDPEITALKSQVDSLTTQLQQREEREVAQGRQAMMTEIENFASAKDKAGQPAYPHLNEVFTDMLPIVATLRQQSPGKSPSDLLTEAYDRAVHANPDTRKLEQARVAKLEDQKRIADAKKIATDASKTTNARPRGTRQGGESAKTLDEELSDKFDNLKD